jgi:hypothetical protein
MSLTASGTLQLPQYPAGTLYTDASGYITASSDERMKNIDGQYSVGLTALLQINPILYRWNESSGLDQENQYAGFSAQNVKASIPEAVFEGKDGLLSLSDRPILAAAINAIKELSKRIEELENQ